MKSHSPKIDPFKIAEIESQLIERVDEIFEHFGFDYVDNRNCILSCCPVHGGDNNTALNLYLDGHTRPGHWVCNTKQCQETFKPTLTGLVRGMLSHSKYGWENHGDKVAGFQETIQFMLEFIGSDYDKIKTDKQYIEKKRFQSKINSLYKEKKQSKISIPRVKVREGLKIPAEYYIDRGYSRDILEKYDVGLCVRANAPMAGRVVVPIYDNKHKFMIACSGRVVDDNVKPKWKHTSGFDADRTLYNSWYAKEHIRNSGVAILVEGPGDVWKLEENGIHNSVAMFGTNLSEGQKDLLDMLGAMSLIVMTDNDEAGRKGAVSIMEKCKKTYRVFFPTFEGSDVGDITSDSITSDIKPMIKKVERTVF
jgi:5S rRNA maturation endonuclease (ribonuclease M5)